MVYKHKSQDIKYIFASVKNNNKNNISTFHFIFISFHLNQFQATDLSFNVDTSEIMKNKKKKERTS